MIYITGAIVLLVTAVLLHLGLPAAMKPFLRRRFLDRVERSSLVCLTFDDGPSSAGTPAILDILDGAGVRATFCVSGRRAASRPKLIARMLAAGHQVMAHGHDHPHPWRSWPWRCRLDTRRGEAAVAHLAGAAAARFVRPPYGKLDLPLLVHFLWRRRTLVFWNVDPRDFATADPAGIVDHVQSSLAPGCVVLLHDGAARTPAEAEVLPRALAGILTEISRRQLATATVAEALAAAEKEGGLRR